MAERAEQAGGTGNGYKTGCCRAVVGGAGDWSAGWNAGLSVLVGGLRSDDWEHLATEHSNAVCSSLHYCSANTHFNTSGRTLLFGSAVPEQWRGAGLSGLAGRQERGLL